MTTPPSTPRGSYVLRPGEGEHLEMGALIKASSEDSDGQSWVLEILNPSPASTPLHVHRRHDEMFYVLQGNYRFQVGEQIVDAPPGTFAYARRGTPHTFVSTPDAPAKLLQIGTPGGLEAFLREMGRLHSRGADADALKRLHERWHTEIVGPPLSLDP